MKHYLFSLVFLLVINTNAEAQIASIAGQIQKQGGAAVSGATVEVLNSTVATVTDAQGEFTLKGLAPGSYKLKITANARTQYIEATAPAAALLIMLAAGNRLLDEIIVQSERREESVQLVPAAVSVLSSDDIDQYRIWNTSELTAIIPTLYSADPGDNRNVTSIRGITSASYEPAVATYIDGVAQVSLDNYISELLDIERIEVLRGPQSTLYGRNATGGVINIITRKPELKTTGFAEASAGNYGLQRYRAGINMRLSKKVSTGVSLMYHGFDGYYINEYNNTSFDKQHSLSGNYFVRYMPSANWSVLLNAKHQLSKNDGAFPLVMGTAAALENPYRLAQDANSRMNDYLWNGSLSIRYTGRQFQLSWETGYQSDYRYYDDRVDADFSPIDGISIYNNYGKSWNRSEAVTQELRLSSPAAISKKRPDWVLGAYLFSQSTPVKQATVFGRDAALMGVPDSLFRIITTSTAKNQGIAFFGQMTVPITEALRITGGLRYDYQHSRLSVKSDYAADAGASFPVQGDTSGSASYNALSPKAGILYVLNPRHSIYINYSRGFRTGGLTQIGSDPSQPALYPFQPEYSNNYELGMKSTFLQNRLRLSGALYYIRATDVQVPSLILPEAITVTTNSGSLESKGAELEVAAFVKGLNVRYAFGYTDAVYTQLRLPHNGAEADYTGNRQIFTPDITSSLAAEYSYLLKRNNKLELVVRGEWYYIGKQYYDQENTIVQPSYQLVHLRAGLRTRRQQLMLWVRNVTDQRYIDYAYSFGGVHLGDPMTYGATFSVHF